MTLRKSCLWVAMASVSLAGLARAQEANAPAYAELSVVGSSSGELQLFAIRRDSEIERRYQLQPGGAFSGVEVLGGQGVDVAAVQLPDARVDAFIIGMDSALWENRQDADGGWTGWIRLGGEARRVAAVSTAAGVALLSLGWEGEITLRQRATEADDWSEPQALGFRAKRLTAVAGATDASLTVFAIGLDGAVWGTSVDLAAPSSSDWESLGALVHDIAVARSASGMLEVALVGDDGAMWNNALEDGVYVGWRRVGGDVARVDLVRSARGIELFGVTPAGEVTVASLDDQRAWSAFTPLSIRDVEPARPLDSTFRGLVQVEIPSLDVSVQRDLSFDVRFSADRSRVEITTFAPIVTDPFDTPFGSNVSTVTWASGGSGTFDPSTGQVLLPVTLHFDQSLSIPFINTDVDAEFALSTAAEGGKAVDPETGQVTLAASSTFRGNGANPLRDAAVRVVLTGAFDPRP